jgi:hypothetical protein
MITLSIYKSTMGVGTNKVAKAAVVCIIIREGKSPDD